MKTNLNLILETPGQAAAWLIELVKNGEDFHPDDDAFSIVWSCDEPTDDEKSQLNSLMNAVHGLVSDPCQIMIDYEKSNDLRH